MELDLSKNQSETDVMTLNKNTISSISDEDNKTSKPEVGEKKRIKMKKIRKKKLESVSEDHRINNKLYDEKTGKKSKTTNQNESVELAEFPSKPKSGKTRSRNKKSSSEVFDENVLAIFIHGSDCLKMDFFILHPVVKVYLVDAETGRLVKKSDTKRRVTSYYEGDHVEYIVPCMTQPYDFKVKRSIIPRWEEILLFNERFEYFRNYGRNLIIFFEILDFVSMTTANHQYSKLKQNGGWHQIAWAFLKLNPNPDRCNQGQKLRLQLFKPQNRHFLWSSAFSTTSKVDGVQTVWKWWNDKRRMAYPSTLYVTVKAVEPPGRDQTAASLRSLVPTQPEIGLSGNDQNHCSANNNNNNEQISRVYTWSRLPGQSCKIPNTVSHELKLKEDRYNEDNVGVSNVLFNNDGRLLAVSASPIVYVYDILSGELQRTFKGHTGYIYQLHWSNNDGRLLSASGDGNVRVWNYSNGDVDCLRHPAYVYCCRFHPNSTDEIIATAGYDQVIRIWSKNEDYRVVQELCGHPSYVTAMEFGRDGQVLFSGDREGTVRIWESSKETDEVWRIKRVLNLEEIKGSNVYDLKVHPGGRRLLIHSRSIANALVMIDLKLGTVMQKYSGSQNLRPYQTGCCITPCGTFIFAGCQDGAIFVWNTDTGAQVHIYTDPFNGKSKEITISSISFHPMDHIFAFSTLKPGIPVMIYKYSSNRNKDGESDDREKDTQIVLADKSTSKSLLNIQDLSSILDKMDGVLASKEST